MQIHRFGDKIAISPPLIYGGRTYYVDPKTARQLSRAINRVCREIERGVSFSDSTVGTARIKESGK